MINPRQLCSSPKLPDGNKCRLASLSRLISKWWCRVNAWQRVNNDRGLAVCPKMSDGVSLIKSFYSRWPPPTYRQQSRLTQSDMRGVEFSAWRHWFAFMSALLLWRIRTPSVVSCVWGESVRDGGKRQLEQRRANVQVTQIGSGTIIRRQARDSDSQTNNTCDGMTPVNHEVTQESAVRRL